MTISPQKKADLHKKLKNIYNQIKLVFFPRWISGKEWKVKIYIGKRPFNGECNRLKKIIYINLDEVQKSNNYLKVLIIHEICHAVTRKGDGHGFKFQERYIKAANRAEAKGMKVISKMILNRIKKNKSLWDKQEEQKKRLRELKKANLEKLFDTNDPFSIRIKENLIKAGNSFIAVSNGDISLKKFKKIQREVEKENKYLEEQINKMQMQDHKSK